MVRVRSLSLAVSAVAVVTALGAGTARATVVERDHYTSEPYSFSHHDCGFTVDVAGTTSGHFRTRAGNAKTDTAFFGLDNYSFTETQTNRTTGKFVTITANAVFNEVRAKRVEGNIFEFWAVEAGQFRMFDSNGRLVARDRGSILWHILFDTGGDEVPGGEVVEEFPPTLRGKHPGFENYCQLLTQLTGS